MKTRFTQMLLAAGILALCSTPAWAQTTGGTGGTGGTAASGTGAATSPGGVGGNSGGSFGTNVGTSSDVMGTAGLGSTNFTGGSGQTTISKANPFYYYYSSPLSAGYGPNVNLLPQNSLSFSSSGGSGSGTLVTGKGTFGAPVANITTSTTGGKGTTGGGGGGGSANITSNFTTIGMKRAPSYVTMIDPELVRAPTTAAMLQLQQDMRASLQNSTALPSGQNLNVTVDNGTLVLTGTVASDRERRLAENLVRLSMTNGVRDVRNQIQLAAGTPRP
jgi:hypothetical protein